MVSITVFTPTYNRAYSLPRLFKSLKKQTFIDFEWVIINDGSTDNTDEIVANFLLEKPFFKIKYKKTENGGKHRAINRGVELVDGRLFFLVDSDDWLRSDALELINKTELSISKDDINKFAGVYGLRIHADGKIIGSTFAGKYKDITYLECARNGITGDKAEIYYTHIIKKYPFPEFEGEMFCTECLVWDQIAADGFKLRYFNEGIYYCEYLEDGLTHGGNMLYARNPKQYGLYVHNNWVYHKNTKLHSMIKIYEYYLFEKNTISFKEIVKNLRLNFLTVTTAIFIQWVFDVARVIFRRKKTIKKSVRNEVKRNY